MTRALTVFAFLFACPAHAFVEGWPALYDVVDVAEDDVLNVRGAPGEGWPIVGTLSHDAKNLEIVRTDVSETWGLVNIDEGVGWVSLRYMKRHPDQMDGDFPEITSCWGTEPFWHLTRDNGRIAYEIMAMDEFENTEVTLWERATVNHRHRYAFRTDSMVAVISRQACNDGMSDIETGLEINLILLNDDLHLQGCCTIQPPAE